MTQRRSIYCHLPILLAALSTVTTFAYGQGAAKPSPPKYDTATEATLKGSVETFKLVPPDGPKAVAYLVMKSGESSLDVYLCPKSFLDDMGVVFKAGDAIQLVGSKITQAGADLTLAREVTRGGDTLTLRFKDGKPAW